jgi:hypothetical protein
MEVGHEAARVGAEVDDFVGEQVGLDAGDAITLDAFDLVELLDELEEGFACGAPEVADVDAGDDDFLAAFLGSGAGLLDEALDAAVAGAASGKRDGAVGAEVVAAVLHLEEVTGAVAVGAGGEEQTPSLTLPLYGEGRGPPLSFGHLPLYGEKPAGWFSLPIEGEGWGGGLLPHLLHNNRYDVAFAVGAEDEVNAWHVEDLLGLELGVAAGDDDKGVGVLADKATDGLAAFLVGYFGDGAGVDDADVGALPFLYGLYAVGFEGLAEGGGFCKVEFAAEGEVGGGFVLEDGGIDHGS